MGLGDLWNKAKDAAKDIDLAKVKDAANNLLDGDAPKDDSCITVECFKEEIQNDLPKVMGMLETNMVQSGLENYGVEVTNNPAQTMDNLAHQMRKNDHLNSAADPVNPTAIANATIAVKEELGDYPHLAVFVAATEEQTQAAMAHVFSPATAAIENEASQDNLVMVYENADGETIVFDPNDVGTAKETQEYQEVDAGVYHTHDVG